MTAKDLTKKNMAMIICAFVLCLAASFFIAAKPVYAEGTRIGQAAAGEGGSLSGNVAGDQSGNEETQSGERARNSHSRDAHLAKMSICGENSLPERQRHIISL